MKEVLYEVQCLKSTEDMILALAGQRTMFIIPLILSLTNYIKKTTRIHTSNNQNKQFFTLST